MNKDSYSPYAPPYQSAGPGTPPPEDLDSAMQPLAGGMRSAAPPPSVREYYNTESFSDVLARGIGYFVVCEFLIGSGGLVEKYGILFAAGVNFLTLYDRDNDSYTTCDLYSLKFVTFYNSRVRPPSFMPRQSAGAPQPLTGGRPIR